MNGLGSAGFGYGAGHVLAEAVDGVTQQGAGGGDLDVQLFGDVLEAPLVVISPDEHLALAVRELADGLGQGLDDRFGSELFVPVERRVFRLYRFADGRLFLIAALAAAAYPPMSRIGVDRGRKLADQVGLEGDSAGRVVCIQKSAKSEIDLAGEVLAAFGSVPILPNKAANQRLELGVESLTV